MSSQEEKLKRTKRRNSMARELHKTIYHQKVMDSELRRSRRLDPKGSRKRQRYVGDGVFIDEDSEWWEYYKDAPEF